MLVTGLIQQLASGRPGQRRARQNQGDLITRSRKGSETGARLFRRSYAHDAVMARVAVAQFSLDVTQRVRIVLNGNKHGFRHVRTLVLPYLAIGRVASERREKHQPGVPIPSPGQPSVQHRCWAFILYSVDAPLSKISHVDLVVSSIEQSLPFYRELLGPIGWSGLREVVGEQGETIYYLSVEGPGLAALGLREKRSDAHGVPYDRYAVGIHHLCFDVPSREVVNERALWLRGRGAQIESGPAEYEHTPGYYAIFFYDPDGIKLELLHRPTYWEWLRGSPQ